MNPQSPEDWSTSEQLSLSCVCQAWVKSRATGLKATDSCGCTVTDPAATLPSSVYTLPGAGWLLNRQSSQVKMEKTGRLCYYGRCCHHALELRAYFLSQGRHLCWFRIPLIASEIWTCIHMSMSHYISSSLNCPFFYWISLVSFFPIICKDCEHNKDINSMSSTIKIFLPQIHHLSMSLTLLFKA